MDLRAGEVDGGDGKVSSALGGPEAWGFGDGIWSSLSLWPDPSVMTPPCENSQQVYSSSELKKISYHSHFLKFKLELTNIRQKWVKSRLLHACQASSHVCMEITYNSGILIIVSFKMSWSKV